MIVLWHWRCWDIPLAFAGNGRYMGDKAHSMDMGGRLAVQYISSLAGDQQ